MNRMLASAARRVIAFPLFARVICRRGARSTRAVAVTFDDGPNPRGTPAVLRVLEEAGVPATFFVLGMQADKHPDLLRLVLEKGHEIGVHGYDHSAREMPLQVRKCASLLAGLGATPRLFRPPRGSVSVRDTLWMIRNGYRTVLWSLDARDSMRAEGKWRGPAPRYEDVSAGDIVLMHDDNEVCVRELPVLLEAARNKGLQAVTVSELTGRGRGVCRSGCFGRLSGRH